MARQRLVHSALFVVHSIISALDALRAAVCWLLAPCFACLALASAAPEPTLPVHSPVTLASHALNRHDVMLKAQLMRYGMAGRVGVGGGAGARMRSRSLGSSCRLLEHVRQEGGDLPGPSSSSSAVPVGYQHSHHHHHAVLAGASEPPGSSPLDLRDRCVPGSQTQSDLRTQGSLSSSLDVLQSSLPDRSGLSFCTELESASASESVNDGSGSEEVWNGLDTPSSIDFAALPFCATSTPARSSFAAATMPIPIPISTTSIPISAPKPIRLCDARQLRPLLASRDSERGSQFTTLSTASSAVATSSGTTADGDINDGENDHNDPNSNNGVAGNGDEADAGEPGSPGSRDVGDFFPMLAYGTAIPSARGRSATLLSTLCTVQPADSDVGLDRSGLEEAGDTLSWHLDIVLGLSSSASSSSSPSLRANPSPSPPAVSLESVPIVRAHTNANADDSDPGPVEKQQPSNERCPSRTEHPSPAHEEGSARLPSPWSALSLTRRANMEMLDARLRPGCYPLASRSRSLFDLDFPSSQRLILQAREPASFDILRPGSTPPPPPPDHSHDHNEDRDENAAPPSPASSPSSASQSSSSSSPSSWEPCSFAELLPANVASAQGPAIEGAVVGVEEDAAGTVRRMLSKSRSYMGWRWRISCPAASESFEVLPSPWSWVNCDSGEVRAEVESEIEAGAESEADATVRGPGPGPAATRKSSEPGGVIVLDLECRLQGGSEGSLWNLCLQAMEVFGAPAGDEPGEDAKLVRMRAQPSRMQGSTSVENGDHIMHVGGHHQLLDSRRWMYHRPGFEF